jgi:hypothetical protein
MSDEEVMARPDGSVAIDQLLAEFPVALLVSGVGEPR